MSQSFDDQLKRAFESLTERLHANLADHLSAVSGQLTSAAATERRAASELAAAEAIADVTARLNESFAGREERIKEATRTEWFEAGLQQARAEALKAQEERDAQARAALDAANRAAELAAAQAAAARAEAAVEAESRTLVRLLEAIRTLDSATALSHALDALAAASKPEADRTAVFLLRSDVLRIWNHVGFDALNETNAAAGISLNDAGVIALAIKTGTAQRVGPHDAGRPVFAGSVTNAVFVAAPVMMNGQPVAVLCADHLAPTDEGKRLAAVLELLARHGARVLESVTALRLAHVGAHAAAPA